MLADPETVLTDDCVLMCSLWTSVLTVSVDVGRSVANKKAWKFPGQPEDLQWLDGNAWSHTITSAKSGTSNSPENQTLRHVCPVDLPYFSTHKISNYNARNNEIRNDEIIKYSLNMIKVIM